MEKQSLIDAIRSGDSQALNEAYHLHSSWLLAYCIASTKSKADAEDIVQDTFLKLWEHRESIQPADSLRPLLLTIARHRLIDVFRKRINDLNYEHYVGYRSQQAIDGREYVDFDLYLTYVKQAIHHLPPAQQTVIMLSDFHGMNNADISAKLNISKKTVDNQLSAGHKRLKLILNDILRFLVILTSI